MIQVTDHHIIILDTPVQPTAFSGLVQRHPRGVEVALALEVAAQRLFAPNVSRRRLQDFIRSVCAWGGYPRTADRVLLQNPFPEIRRRFGQAIVALSSDEPNIRVALRELSRIRHLGVSFASKHLRFLCPEVCPVLDHVLSKKLGYPLHPRGYKRFSDDCRRIAAVLQQRQVYNPYERDGGAWFAADVEMALFVWVKEGL